MPRKTRAAGPPTPPPLRDIAEMKNAELRAELQTHGKSTQGNKKELSERLAAVRAERTPRPLPPVPAPRPGTSPRPTPSPSPRPKPSVTMTPTELRAELRLSGLSTRGDKSDLRHRVERARRGSAAVGRTPPAVAPRPGSATQRSPPPGPPPVDQLSERELRVALERHGLDPVSGTEAMREQLQDPYQAQSALLSSGAPAGTTGFEARLQTLPADLGALQQRQAAAAAPRRSASAPRTRSARRARRSGRSSRTSAVVRRISRCATTSTR